MEEQKQTTQTTDTQAPLTVEQKAQLLDAYLSRFGINADSTINVDALYGTVQKQFVERLSADEVFKKPIFDAGFGQAMGKTTTMLKQKFGVEVKDRSIEDIVTDIASRQSVDAQELVKYKQIAEVSESRLMEYEEKVLPAKKAEIENMRREYETEMMLKREVSDISIVGAPIVAIQMLKTLLPARYNIDLSSGNLRFVNKNGTPVTKPNSMVEYTTREIIASMLDEVQLLNNNNAVDTKKQEERKIETKIPTTRGKNAALEAAMKNLEGLNAKK